MSESKWGENVKKIRNDFFIVMRPYHIHVEMLPSRGQTMLLLCTSVLKVDGSRCRPLFHRHKSDFGELHSFEVTSNLS